MTKETCFSKIKVSISGVIPIITKIIVVILWIVIAALIAITISFNSNITFTNPPSFIKDMANATILVSSIILATIYAIITILSSNPEEEY